MRSWAEIDLDNLAYNVKKIQELCGEKELMAVVKADAYGLGAVRITKELERIGVKKFAVSSLEEGIELRVNGIDSEILILGGCYKEEYFKAKEYNLQITISDYEKLNYLLDLKVDLEIQLKVDTGMGRLGFTIHEIEDVLKKCIENKINILGIYSHFSVSDEKELESKEFTKQQILKFKKVIEKVNVRDIHILNSGGILNYSEIDYSNVARAGIMLYGYYGDEKIKKLKNVLTLKSRILSLKKLKEDTYISYGRTKLARENEVIATVSIGYADGLKRCFSNKTTLEVHGVDCEIVGNICMDMVMIKIPKRLYEKVKIGDEVLVLRDDISKQTKDAETLIYEVFTGISKRVPRIYLQSK